MVNPERLGRAVSQHLASNLDPVTMEGGETLFRQGDTGDAIYILVNGQLAVSTILSDGTKVQGGVIDPGEVAGDIHIFGGGRYTATVRALCRSELFKLTRSVFESLDWDSVQELLRIIRRRLRRNQLGVILHGLFGFMSEGLLAKVEHFLEWLHLQQGEVLYRQGDQSDGLYIIVSGRLEALKEDVDGVSQVIGEVTRGEVVGEISLFTGERRTRTVRCIRDSDLVRVSKESFEKLIDERPQLMMAITRLLVKRMSQRSPTSRKKRKELGFAILAAHPGVHLSHFTQRLAAASSELTPTLHLSSPLLDDLIPIKGVSRASQADPHGLNLSVWLDEQESRYGLILYETDPTATPWSRRCLRRAEHVIIVAQYSEDLWKKESWTILHDAGAATKTLVLLHPDRSCLPHGTRQWIDHFQVHDHHHMPGDTDDEYKRLARILTGNAFGLVLSGGGANAFAHIGVIRALQEAGVPIDLIGGTSMGAVIAAQYAMGMNWEELIQANRKMWIEAKPSTDFTLPLISLLSFRRFDAVNKACFRDVMIEDLWVDFFCVSTNLTKARPVIHRRGLVHRAIRSSCALPGITPPVIEDGELLVDGAILNNLPVDVMREMRDCIVMAVDASDKGEFRVHQEMVPSSWEVLRELFAPSADRASFPNLLDIITRTAVVSSIHKTQMAMEDADFHLRPPLEGINQLDLSCLDRAVQLGYECAREKIREWKDRGFLKKNAL